MSGARPDVKAPESPHAALRAAVGEAADRLAAAGEAEAARELRAALDAWWREQRDWTAEVARLLGVHHDINNALVGVRGNAQLLMMGPAGAVPAARDRLEVVLREADRIRDAAHRLLLLKSALAAQARESGPEEASRAA